MLIGRLWTAIFQMFVNKIKYKPTFYHPSNCDSELSFPCDENTIYLLLRNSSNNMVVCSDFDHICYFIDLTANMLRRTKNDRKKNQKES